MLIPPVFVGFSRFFGQFQHKRAPLAADVIRNIYYVTRAGARGQEIFLPIRRAVRVGSAPHALGEHLGDPMKAQRSGFHGEKEEPRAIRALPLAAKGDLARVLRRCDGGRDSLPQSRFRSTAPSSEGAS